MQISAFFLFSNIRKGRLLYIHPVGWPVDWSVGWLTSPLIFSIYTGIKALYKPSTTQYQSVPSDNEQVPPSYEELRYEEYLYEERHYEERHYKERLYEERHYEDHRYEEPRYEKCCYEERRYEERRYEDETSL